jgi:hypothetical protein
MQSRDEELAESLMRAHIRRVRQLVVVDVFPVTTPKQVFGSLPAKGKAKTIEEMDRGVLAEATRRHKRGSQGGKGA